MNPEEMNLAEKLKQQMDGGYIISPKGEKIPKVMPVEFPVGDPEKIKLRNEESKRIFPEVAVDEDEYVILSIFRHQIGVLGIWSSVALILVLLVSSWIILCLMPNNFNLISEFKNTLSIIFLCVFAMILIGGYLTSYIYRKNRLVITNERAIQYLVSGIFNQKKQAIKLESIEDISFSKVGILSYIFDYGTVRLSTTGDESTYTFPFAKNPAKIVEVLGDIAENARENQFNSDELLKLAKKLSR